MQCASCQSPMQSLGEISLRIGGTTGGWHLLFGQWADANEDLFPLDLFRCTKCKRVEFFDLKDRLSKDGETR